MEGSVHFECALPNRRQRGFPLVLVPVRLGERHYLLEPEQVARFLAKADHHAFVDDRDAKDAWFFGEGELYFLRVGDETLSAIGAPQFLDGYRR